MKSTQLIKIYPKITFHVTYSTSCLKRSFILSNNYQEEAAQSVGDTKASYDPKKCEGKAGRKKERIHHRIVEKMEARCTFENFTKNYNEQEKEGDAYHFIPAIG